eukprot:TRINITY_DN32742_c0_g1_i1.p2 TRINITY_DN32742_c0_g1~~TRINITY_DN32742_c0_g1_i1.p2  ORF type:complete len:100 (+),score=10.65 TRINITY_DN32742_c0_g1_i1:221-520(+)
MKKSIIPLFSEQRLANKEDDDEEGGNLGEARNTFRGFRGYDGQVSRYGNKLRDFGDHISRTLVFYSSFQVCRQLDSDRAPRVITNHILILRTLMNGGQC